MIYYSTTWETLSKMIVMTYNTPKKLMLNIPAINSFIVTAEIRSSMI